MITVHKTQLNLLKKKKSNDIIYGEHKEECTECCESNINVFQNRVYAELTIVFKDAASFTLSLKWLSVMLTAGLPGSWKMIKSLLEKG